MENLSFTKQGRWYVAETTVTGDYNLHVGRKSAGGFQIQQRGTASGLWVPCILPYYLVNTGQVIDHSFSHGVYPEGGMHVKFMSETEVTSGVLSYGKEE